MEQVNIEICKRCKRNYLKIENGEMFCARYYLGNAFSFENISFIKKLTEEEKKEFLAMNKCMNIYGSMKYCVEFDKDDEEMKKFFEGLKVSDRCKYHLEHSLYDWNKDESRDMQKV